MSFGSRVRDLRSQWGWTQAELLIRLAAEGHEVSQSTLSKIESGRRELRLTEAVHYASALHTTLDYLAGRGEPTSGDTEAREQLVQDLHNRAVRSLIDTLKGQIK